MMEKKYQGVVVPMVSPLTAEGAVDIQSVEKMVKVFAENSIHPLVLGTTGESASFGAKESIALVKAAVQAKGANQLIYVGLVGTNVAQQITVANEYFKMGADVVVATLPSYYILTADQMKGFYNTLADSLSGPLMVYNIKSTTQMSIPLAVIEELSRHENISGLKDSERDVNRLKTCISNFKDRKDFSFFCGWGAQSANSLKWGADGIVPSTGNLVPEMYKILYMASLNHDYDKADLFQVKTDNLAAIYQNNRTLGQSLAALKEMMNVMGLCKPHMMPPLSTLDEEDREYVRRKTIDYFSMKT